MGREWTGSGHALKVKQTALAGSLDIEAKGKRRFVDIF